jgi:hypothetical protein
MCSLWELEVVFLIILMTLDTSVSEMLLSPTLETLLKSIIPHSMYVKAEINMLLFSVTYIATVTL